LTPIRRAPPWFSLGWQERITLEAIEAFPDFVEAHESRAVIDELRQDGLQMIDEDELRSEHRQATALAHALDVRARQLTHLAHATESAQQSEREMLGLMRRARDGPAAVPLTVRALERVAV
jgi:hypothetical protein